MGVMLPFFFGGMWLKNKLTLIERYKGYIGLACAVVFICIFPFFSSADLFANKFFHEITFSALLHWTICITMGLTGSMMVICGCMYLDKYFANTYCLKLFTKIGTYTLGIYLTQKILLELILPHFVKVSMNITVYNLLFTPLVALAFLFICYYVTLSLRKTKFTRILFLGEKK